MLSSLPKNPIFPQVPDLNGAVVSMSDYEFAGPSSILDVGSQRTAHPAVHFPKQVGW